MLALQNRKREPKNTEAEPERTLSPSTTKEKTQIIIIGLPLKIILNLFLRDLCSTNSKKSK